MEEKLKKKTERFQKANAEKLLQQLSQRKDKSKDPDTFRDGQGFPKEGQQLFKSAAEIRREELQKKQLKETIENSPKKIQTYTLENKKEKKNYKEQQHQQ